PGTRARVSARQEPLEQLLHVGLDDRERLAENGVAREDKAEGAGMLLETMLLEQGFRYTHVFESPGDAERLGAEYVRKGFRRRLRCGRCMRLLLLHAASSRVVHAAIGQGSGLRRLAARARRQG